MPELQNALRIAVIEEQIVGLREQQKLHNESTQARLDKLSEKIDELTAIMNRGKGAYAASMALAAGVGAILIQAGSLLSSIVHSR